MIIRWLHHQYQQENQRDIVYLLFVRDNYLKMSLPSSLKCIAFISLFIIFNYLRFTLGAEKCLVVHC